MQQRHCHGQLRLYLYMCVHAQPPIYVSVLVRVLCVLYVCECVCVCIACCIFRSQVKTQILFFVLVTSVSCEF